MERPLIILGLEEVGQQLGGSRQESVVL